MEPAVEAARTGRLSRWLKIHLFEFTQHQVSLLEEPVIAQNIFSNKTQTRGLGFFFDPIIAHALLGERNSKYPPMPTAEEFESRGYILDLPAIVKKVRALLYSGAVPISRRDVCQGERETLSFGTALQCRLFHTLSADTQKMIRNYINVRVEQETLSGSPATSVSTFGSVTSAVSFDLHNRAERAELLCLQKDIQIRQLKQQVSSLMRQKRCVEARAVHSDALAKVSQQEANAKQAEVIKTQKKLAASEKREAATKRKLWRSIYKERSKPDLGLDGRRPMEVRNICFDPKRHRDAWEKRRRDPAVAYECAWVMIQGTKEPRPFGGGVRWTVEARYEEFANFVESGMEAARRAVFLRERALHGRAMRVFLVPHGRGGCLRRNVLFTSKQKKARAEKAARAMAEEAARASNDSGNLSGQSLAQAENLRSSHVAQVSAEKLAAADKELTAEQALNATRPLDGVRLFDHPSMRTTYREIIPTCQLLFSRLVGGVLYDESTERVGLCCDFAKSKGFGCMGAVIMVFQSVVKFEDPLGGKLYDFSVRSFTLPMTQSTNKISRELFDAEGNSLMPEAAKCLVKAFFVGNTARHFLEHPELWVLACDGAAENSGRGNAERARENLCSPGGIYWEVAITKRAWPGVMEGAEEAGLRKQLDDFFGNSDVKWPGRQTAEEEVGVAATETPQLLDTSGSVHKDPTIVAVMRAMYLTGTIKAKNNARTQTLLELEKAVEQVQPNKSIKCFGPFRLSEGDKLRRQEQADKLAKRETEFQLRLYRARKKALHLYKERIRLLEEHQHAVQRTGPPVSMEHNPARFFPGLCTPDGGSLGEARHCGMHRSQNHTELFVRRLNKGFLEQCVSSGTYFGSEYRWPEISSAINFLLVPSMLEGISEKSGFYSKILDLIREIMELDTLIKQCGFDIRRRAQPPVTAGMARWGTALGAAEYLDDKGPLLAHAVIKRYGHGLEETKIKACADALKPDGFVSRLYQNIQIERHAERHFALITRPSDRLQLAIAAFVNSVVERPLLAAISSNHECGLEAMGVNGKIRCILLVLTRDIWVRCFPHRGWGLGWNRRTTLAFRNHGAEFNPESSIRILDPHCEDKLKRRFGDFPGMEKLVEGAAKATAKLLRTIKLLARMEGQMLPDDSLQHWKQANSHLAELTAGSAGSNASAKHKQLFQGLESFAARVSQAQWLVMRVAEDCVNAIVRVHGGMHRELFGISGWIANMGKSIKSPHAHKIQQPGGATVQSQVVIPDKFAVPNAVNAFVQARDLLAHYEKMGIQKGELLKRLPTYCRWWATLEQLKGFINQEVKRVSGDGQQTIGRDGYLIFGAHTSLLKPLSFFPEADKCSRQASTCLCNSKPVESSFSPMKVVARGKGQARFALLSMLYRKRNFSTALINAKENIVRDKDLYWKAQALATLRGWDWVNMRDEVMGDVFRDADLEDHLKKKNKTVARGGDFADPRHGGSSRTEKYEGAAGRGKEGGGAGRGSKRAREESIDVLVKAADSDNANMQRIKAKRVRKKATPALELEGDRTAAQISQHARLCLARKKAAIEKERRRQRIEKLQKERAERRELANADSDLDYDSDGGPASGSALASDGDNDDYVPGSSAVGSAGSHSSRFSLRVCRSAESAPKRARTVIPPGNKVNRVDHDAERSGDHGESSLGQTDQPAAVEAEKAPGARTKARSGHCSAQPPSRGRGGRKGGGTKVSVTREGRRRAASPDASSAPGDEDISDNDDLPLACRREACPAEGHTLTVTAPPVGAKIYIKWDQRHWKGWFKGTVIAISDGKLAAPGRRRNVVKQGYSIVEYDDAEKNHYVHLLDEAHHVSKRGNQVDAWVLLPSNAGNVGSGVGRQAEPLRGATACDDDDDRPLWDKDAPLPGGSSSGPAGGDRAQVGAASPASDPTGPAVPETLLRLSSGAGGADDDDDAPLFAQATWKPGGSSCPAGGNRAQVGAASPSSGPQATGPTVSDTQLRLSSGAEKAVRLRESNRPVASRQHKKNVWSLSYCFEVFENIEPGDFRLGIAKYSAGSYSVTRQMPKNGEFPKEADIKIHVKTERSKVCYVAYTEETGTTLFMVTLIRKPKGTDWSNTLRGYQMFATEEALTRVDEEQDTTHKGCATSLGAASLRRELDTERSRKTCHPTEWKGTTYHPTDWEVPMDVRCIVGVVRQAQDKDRESYDMKVHASWPAKTSLIFSGLAFSEGH